MLLLVFWARVYGRNRRWAEVANETARSLERKFKVEGVSIAFSRAATNRSVTLRNTDELDKPLAEPVTLRLEETSMHRNVNAFLGLVGLVVVAAVLLL